jgi:hypothetical protein
LQTTTLWPRTGFGWITRGALNANDRTDQRSASPLLVRTLADPVTGELIKSRGDWCLIQPATVPPPLVRIERYWCDRPIHSGLGKKSIQRRMRSMAIIVILEFDQPGLEIGPRPEQDSVEVLAPNRPDQSLYERM